MTKKVVYIAGPITGVAQYWEPFENAMDLISALGMIPLSPTWQPLGLTREQYMKLSLSMLQCADVVYFLPNWELSDGCKAEWAYASTTGKKIIESRDDLMAYAKAARMIERESNHGRHE